MGIRQPAEKVGRVRDARLTALLAEDRESNALWACAALEHFQCQVLCVCDGAAAVDAAIRSRFDIIFMDYHMPVMDGLIATRAIRAHELAHALPRTPIIAITASAMLVERRQCLDCGMDDVLTKPFRIAHLERLLARWAPVL